MNHTFKCPNCLAEFEVDENFKVKYVRIGYED